MHSANFVGRPNVQTDHIEYDSVQSKRQPAVQCTHLGALTSAANFHLLSPYISRPSPLLLTIPFFWTGDNWSCTASKRRREYKKKRSVSLISKIFRLNHTLKIINGAKLIQKQNEPLNYVSKRCREKNALNVNAKTFLRRH